MNSPIANLNFQDLRRGTGSVFEIGVSINCLQPHRNIHFMIAERIRDEIIISDRLRKFA
ncbi:hypothetical protein LEP1GSC068_1462 [Leptospira sp. Fiocruz LV3954]|nr:hypothetical protein LEP1GSC068_1462 [Leptospira sp. Fiocruz LV3954]EMI63840.1 hypothetical protein LEP1GSC076_3073 [Leptospira sp. Fiocruz LV4135]